MINWMIKNIPKMNFRELERKTVNGIVEFVSKKEGSKIHRKSV